MGDARRATRKHWKASGSQGYLHTTRKHSWTVSAGALFTEASLPLLHCTRCASSTLRCRGCPFLLWKLIDRATHQPVVLHVLYALAAAESRLGEARVRAVLAGSRSAPIIAAQPPDWVKEVSPASAGMPWTCLVTILGHHQGIKHAVGRRAMPHPHPHPHP